MKQDFWQPNYLDIKSSQKLKLISGLHFLTHGRCVIRSVCKYSNMSSFLGIEFLLGPSQTFVILATYGQGHKETLNDQYDSCYPLITRDAVDERNFVKKAINWAIREIGKRNVDLQQTCISLCEELIVENKASKSANWIAKNALKELQSPDVRIRNYPRSIYG